MKSFTNGTPEMVDAMKEALPEFYEMRLVYGDMEALISYLAVSVGFISPEDISDDERERAESLFSSIAENLGIEGI